MVPTIRIDDDVWMWLKSQATPLEDTPNTVLRRVAGLDLRNAAGIGTPMDLTRQVIRRRRVRSDHFPQAAFREPILKLLLQHGGALDRPFALAELERMLADQLTEADRSDIESGTIRWQKNAEWQVYAMRQAGLLEPVEASGSGRWQLTARGRQMAADLA